MSKKKDGLKLNDWQKVLQGTFHQKNGQTVIMDLKAPAPDQVSIYFNTPYHRKGDSWKQIQISAYPPEVFEWLRARHPQFIIPPTLSAKIIANKQPEVAAWCNWMKIESLAYYGAWKIEPWYFFSYYDHENSDSAYHAPLVRMCLPVNFVNALKVLSNPSEFFTLNHDSFFNQLLTLDIELLIKLWFELPDYFNLLNVAKPERWQALSDRIREGLSASSS